MKLIKYSPTDGTFQSMWKQIVLHVDSKVDYSNTKYIWRVVFYERWKACYIRKLKNQFIIPVAVQMKLVNLILYKKKNTIQKKFDTM